MGYRIKTVSEVTGIPRSTIVAWERRYGVIDPQRGNNRYRQYSDADIATLVELKTLVDSGYRISEAVDLLRNANPAVPASGGEALEIAVKELLQHLLAFDRAAADRVRSRLSTVPFRQIVDRLLSPLARAIGLDWERGVCSIAQEHYATAWIRDQLVAMLLQLECGPITGPLVACATPSGEHHEIGLLGLTVHLALMGQRVSYLGSNLPVEELASYAAAERPALVCLSLTKRRDAASLRQLATEMRTILPASTRLMIGGQGIPNDLALTVPGVRFAKDLSEALMP
jgi:DNA-binding transcriptional MerR regulator/methylmalonyl-CoA mutase cobalamin-binding subunit